MLADTFSLSRCRLRTGAAVDDLCGRCAHPRRGQGPALLGLEPPCVFLLMWLQGLSGSFRHGCTPAMACHWLGNGGPLQVALELAEALGALVFQESRGVSHGSGTAEASPPQGHCRSGDEAPYSVHPTTQPFANETVHSTQDCSLAAWPPMISAACWRRV